MIKEIIHKEPVTYTAEEEESSTVPARPAKGKKGDSKAKQAKAAVAAPEVVEEQWVQCDVCKKWRNVPPPINPDTLPEQWECKDNTWNTALASCDAAEGALADEAPVTAAVEDVATLPLPPLVEGPALTVGMGSPDFISPRGL